MENDGFSFSNALAKFRPDVTLKQHIDDCVIKFKLLIERNSKKIDLICNSYGLDKDVLLRNAFTAITLHDIGKLNADFQNAQGKRRTYPHPLISLAIAENAFGEMCTSRLNGEEICLELAAIETHHSRLRAHKYDGYQYKAAPYVKPDAVVEGEDYLENIYYTFWGERRKIPLNTKISNPFSVIQKIDYSLAKLQREGGYKERTAFMLIKGLLNQSDWLASSEKVPIRPIADLFNPVRDRLGRIRNFRKLYLYQEEALKKHGSCILNAPTGKGKTEAGLFWACANSPRKLIYLLPTMITTNSIFEKLRKYYGENVSLCHSTANFLLGREAEENDVEEKFDFASMNITGKTFGNSITVATVDQVLYALLNNGRWEPTLFNVANSNIIIDEMHNYEPYTIGLIVEVMHRLQKWDTNILFMSATIPEGLKEFIIQKLDLSKKDEIEDQEFKNQIRHSLVIHEDDEILNLLDLIKKDFSRDKKVLVVCNTVLYARKVYNELIRVLENDVDRITIMHSQFILKERMDKEKTLQTIEESYDNRGMIVVATQVVEVSLDIDYDVLYTEAAPLDALVQRMGRVNRRGDKGIVEVHICKAHADSFKIYPEKIPETVQSLGSINTISTKDIDGLSNEVYPIEDHFDELENGLKEARKAIRDVMSTLSYVYNLSELEEIEGLTRPSTYRTLWVVPAKFEEELKRAKPMERIGFAVKAPYYICKGKIRKDEETDYCIVDLDYDDTGLLRIGHEMDGVII